LDGANALSSFTLVKVLLASLSVLGAVSLCACTVPATPTSPTAAVTADTTTITADGFDSTFYRAFLQNGYESPDRLEEIRILHGPLRIYLRTFDDGGRAIDRATLDATERTLIEAAKIWSGEMFSAQIERGSATRERQAGWLTVKWAMAPSGERCGRSTVGVDGGFIELNASGSCSCGSTSLVYPRLVRHELGHAMGYYHTDSPADVMYGNIISSETCDLLPSDRERRHAKIAHQSN